MQTTSRPLRVGVLGTGRIGRFHAEIVARQVPGAAVAVLYDADEESAREVARRLGVATAGSVAEVIESTDVDAVAVCTPTGRHAEQVVAAAQAGKAIFCEKPVSLDLAETDLALAAVAAAGVPFQIGFNQRFDPGHAAVAAAVAEGRIGDPELVRITSRDAAPPPLEYARGSGGIFLDMTVHDFDMARHVVGSEVVEVYATGSVRVDPAFADIGDYDTVAVTLTHANGCLTTIDGSRRSVYGYDQRVEAFGSAARGRRARRDRPSRRRVGRPVPRPLRGQLRRRVERVRDRAARRPRPLRRRPGRPRPARDRPRRRPLGAGAATGHDRGDRRRGCP
jgi:myo-inositol 2-dehydrogenase / D-chiro-inositol 1-dehydrogenase